MQVQDFTVRHCSRSKLTDWTSGGWIDDNMRSMTLTSLKLERVNAAFIVHVKHEFKSLKVRTPVLHINLGAACTRITFLN